MKLLVNARSLVASLVVSLVLFLVAGGCAPPPDGLTEDDRIRHLLATRGFDVRQIELGADDVIVEGDVVFSRADLRAELPENEPGLESQTQPAYWFTTGDRPGSRPSLLTVPAAADLRLVFDSGIDDRTAGAVRRAMSEAAQRWNQVSGGCISISESNRGTAVKVKVQDLYGIDPETRRAVPVAGRARMPFWSAGAWQAGNIVWIDRQSVTDGPTWLAHVALHELGHILGFPHPFGVSAGQHIPGTASAAVRDYPTVMDYEGEETELSPDDIRGVQRMYRKDSRGRCPGS